MKIVADVEDTSLAELYHAITLISTPQPQRLQHEPGDRRGASAIGASVRHGEHTVLTAPHATQPEPDITAK